MPLYHHTKRQKVAPPTPSVLVGNYAAVNTTNANYSLTQDGSGLRLANTGNINTNPGSPDYSQNIGLYNTSVGYSIGQTVTAKMKFNSFANGDQIGFGLRASNTGARIVSLACPAGVIGGFRRCTFVNNSFGTNFGDVAFTHSVGTSFWMSVQDDGTNFNFGYSTDGVNFNILSRNKVNYGANYASNQVFLLMVPYYNSTTGNRTDVTYESITIG